ncbi:MAG: hypothetical protein KZQ95_16220, partial [Candidatus Thiodiazotropha sp. (ex Epidulcina cf. delphinae)]|nr:hypothetical protein [Candidatus Thiodiazotropha sp. (ex Epidulcina cf. delphinae)]
QCGISDGSIKRLIDAKILSATQVAPYAPIERNLDTHSNFEQFWVGVWLTRCWFKPPNNAVSAMDQSNA